MREQVDRGVLHCAEVHYLGHQALEVSRARDAVPPREAITGADTLEETLALLVQLLHWSLQDLGRGKERRGEERRGEERERRGGEERERRGGEERGKGEEERGVEERRRGEERLEERGEERRRRGERSGASFAVSKRPDVCIMPGRLNPGTMPGERRA